ncbi:glycosyltransferase family 2 protein [Candidatus Bathyarchaeota archaeon]|nr:glycosyltransferase family 2 protein [Candidatus Bathyarchaeota archaeon]
MEEKLCIYAVIPARNEEERIERTLLALKEQTFNLTGIIVVNDGSTDRTAKIAARYSEVIDLPPHEESYIGRPELALVLNEGLKRIPDYCDYVLVLGADHVLPRNYIKTIIERMIKEDVRIASGYIKGEPYHPEMPRGSGRIYDFRLLKSIGFFPVNWGWESYVIFKFMQMGYKVRCYRDIEAGEIRPTGMSKRKLFYYGKAMRALGYDFKYAVGRAVINGSWSMIKGYLSKDIKVYEDINDFVREWQRENFWRRVRAILKAGGRR